MELVAGFLLWIGDVLGVKWIRKENNSFKKLVKAITYLLVGVVIVMLYFAISFR
jgi:hypothetical protein